MATLSGLVSFTPGTPAVASQVNSNFTAVKNFVEAISSGVNLDAGSVSFAKLAADVANKLVPVGTVAAYAGATAPTGWLLCNGTSTSGYPALAAIVGATTPDFRGRTLVGQSASAPFNGALLSVLGSTTSVASHGHTFSSGVASSSGTGHSHNVSQVNSGSHSHSGTTNDNGFHSHSTTVDQLDDTTPHGHGQDGTFVSGTNASPDGETSATVDGSGIHAHSFGTNTAGDHGHSVSVPSGGEHSHSVSGTVVAFGDTHGNVQPSAIVNYIIKHD